MISLSSSAIIRGIFLIIKGRNQSFDHLEREAKSACKDAASHEDLIDLKHLVSFA